MTKYFYYISIALLVCAFAHLPYGYYTFLRIFLFIAALYTLMNIKLKPLYFCGWLFVAILYNPIIKIYLSRDIWQVINIATIIFIAFYLWKNRRA